jgi:hypothetical protein
MLKLKESPIKRRWGLVDLSSWADFQSALVHLDRLIYDIDQHQVLPECTVTAPTDPDPSTRSGPGRSAPGYPPYVPTASQPFYLDPDRAPENFGPGSGTPNSGFTGSERNRTSGHMALGEEIEMQGMSRQFNMTLDPAGSNNHSPALSSERQSY